MTFWTSIAIVSGGRCLLCGSFNADIALCAFTIVSGDGTIIGYERVYVEIWVGSHCGVCSFSLAPVNEV